LFGRRSRLADVVIAISVIVTIAHPLALCVGCELDQPIDTSFDGWVAGWYVTSTFLSSLLRLRRAVLVPIFTVICLLAAHPLGGVSVETLAHNEGPFVVLAGGPFFALVFLGGLLLRTFLDRAQRSPLS